MGVYRHAREGFTLVLPDGWHAQEDVASVALVAAEPEGAHPAFRANLTVTVERAGGLDAEGLTDASLAAQERALESFQLIDRTTAQLAGGSGTRTLGHHDMQGRAIVIEQWRLVAGDRGYGVTASCWALDYDDLADVFAAAAETLRAGVEP